MPSAFLAKNKSPKHSMVVEDKRSHLSVDSSVLHCMCEEKDDDSGRSRNQWVSFTKHV